MRREDSVLLVIDLQERLAPAIRDGRAVLDGCAWLAALAQRLDVPVVVTEHCPDKLGPTVPEMRAALSGAEVVTKRRFSAYADGCLEGSAVERCAQVVMCGTETHVCVQQTALDLAHAGRQVFLVADATGSRHAADRDHAIARMRAHGVEVVTREMVAFEWLASGDDPRFGEINRVFLRDAGP